MRRTVVVRRSLPDIKLVTARTPLRYGLLFAAAHVEGTDQFL